MSSWPARVASSGLILLLAGAATVAGCAAGTETPDEDQVTTSALSESGQGADAPLATAFFSSRAALFFGCTATKIAPRFVLTAAHCQIKVGARLEFYPSGPVPAGSTTRTVTHVFLPTGVDVSGLSGSTNDSGLNDHNGDFADMAVAELDSPVPSDGNIATLAWHYPSGGDEWGTKIGASSGEVIPPRKLRMVNDQVYSDNDDDGHFLTENMQTDEGDSGGPFYDKGRVLGVLSGAAFEFEYRDKYAAVPFRIDWIVKEIGFTWGGQPVDVGMMREGNIIDVILSSDRQVCAYACEHTSACAAFNFEHIADLFTICNLLSSVDTTFATPVADSALK